MDIRLEFKSALNPDKIGYRLSSEWNWNNKGNAPLAMYLTQFETYGDGMTQHSGEWCVQWADLTDLAISLTQAIVGNPQNPAWKQLTYIFHDTNPESIDFALGLKYREDKRQWYNFGERKVSSAESKRHDKRWEEVQSWMDGTPSAAVSILLQANTHFDWIQKLSVVDDVRARCGGCPRWEEMFKPCADLQGDWQQAFHALRAAAKAMAQLDYAGRAVESARYNSTPKEEAKAA